MLQNLDVPATAGGVFALEIGAVAEHAQHFFLGLIETLAFFVLGAHAEMGNG